MQNGSWGDTLTSPLPGRECKPRYSGLTMVIDSGIGLRGMQDVMDSSASWIDFWKFGFGTSYLYSEDFLREKLALLTRYGILAYPGGTLFETAVVQGRTEAFFDKAAEIGFRCIEISDGTIELEPGERYRWIREAKRRGFVVLAETGKKKAGLAMTVERYARQLEQDLDCGADFVIVEGRESGRNVGFYREDGSILEREILFLMDHLSRMDRVLWEAPQKSQQEFFLRHFGINANLGNIHPSDVLALETLRRGLRSDTLRWILKSPEDSREAPAAVRR